MSTSRRHPQTGILRLFRYRFDSSRQLECHLHTMEARTLLFFPTAAELRSGDPVILEVNFDADHPRSLLRGRVEAVEQGQFSGAWLEFATLDTLVAATGCHDIRAPRLPINLFVRVERKGALPVLCRLQDVSAAGARVCGLGAQVSLGEELKFSLAGRFGSWRGRVCWARPGMTGVRFEIAQSQILEAAFVRRPVMIEHRHFSDCGCSRGNLREPPVTRVLAAVSHTARSLSNQQRVG